MTNKPVKHTRKKIDPVKRRNRKINNSLVISLCVLSIFVIVFFVFNIVTVAMKKEASGKNNSLSAETNKTMRNDQYEIGNNPTAIQKEYFQALTDAVKSSDNKKIALFVKGRRFLYFRYTTCYTVRASLPIHASSNGDYRQLLHGAVPLGTETPE